MTISLALLLAACGGDAPAPGPAAEPATPPAPAADAHAGHDAAAAGAFAALAGDGQRVFFVQPADGATVPSPVKLVFGAEGVEVRAAGELVPNTGHHHILVDGAPVEAGAVVPKDDRNIHYGQGQTEAELPLVPGPHTLTLQFADGMHRSYGPAMTATISIVVENPPVTD